MCSTPTLTVACLLGNVLLQRRPNTILKLSDVCTVPDFSLLMDSFTIYKLSCCQEVLVNFSKELGNNRMTTASLIHLSTCYIVITVFSPLQAYLLPISQIFPLWSTKENCKPQVLPEFQTHFNEDLPGVWWTELFITSYIHSQFMLSPVELREFFPIA